MFSKLQKTRYTLVGGLMGLILGAWMLFYLKNKFGIIIALISSLILIWGWKNDRN